MSRAWWLTGATNGAPDSTLGLPVAVLRRRPARPLDAGGDGPALIDASAARPAGRLFRAAALVATGAGLHARLRLGLALLPGRRASDPACWSRPPMRRYRPQGGLHTFNAERALRRDRRDGRRAPIRLARGDRAMISRRNSAGRRRPRLSRPSRAAPGPPPMRRASPTAAASAGLLYGASIGEEAFADPAYAALYRRETRILTTDVALKFDWLRPTPETLRLLSRADAILREARASEQADARAHADLERQCAGLAEAPFRAARSSASSTSTSRRSSSTLRRQAPLLGRRQRAVLADGRQAGRLARRARGTRRWGRPMSSARSAASRRSTRRRA